MKHKLQNLLKHKLQWLLLLAALLGMSQGVWAGAGSNWFDLTFAGASTTQVSGYNNGNFSSDLGELKITSSNALKISEWHCYWYKDGSGNVCGSGKLYWRIGTSGSFTLMDQGSWSWNTTTTDCKYNNITQCNCSYKTSANTTVFNSSTPGTYTLQFYFMASGNASSTSSCGDLYNSNNSKNYSVTFTVPGISVQPSTSSQSLCKNGSATALSVTAVGSSPSYQWQSATTSGGTYSNISGANSSSYTPPTGTVGTKYYRCKVTISGTTYTSDPSGAIVVKDLPTLTGIDGPTQLVVSTNPAGTYTTDNIANATYTWSTTLASGSALNSSTSNSVTAYTGATTQSGKEVSVYATKNSCQGNTVKLTGISVVSSCTAPTSASDITDISPSSEQTITLCGGDAPSVTQSVSANCAKGDTYLWSASPNSITYKIGDASNSTTRANFTNGTKMSATMNMYFEGEYIANFAVGCSNTSGANKNTSKITVYPGTIYLNGPFFNGSDFDGSDHEAGRTDHNIEIVDSDNDHIFTYEWIATYTSGEFTIKTTAKGGDPTHILANYANLSLTGISKASGGNHNLSPDIGTITAGDRLRLTIKYTGVDGSGVPEYDIKLKKIPVPTTADADHIDLTEAKLWGSYPTGAVYEDITYKGFYYGLTSDPDNLVENGAQTSGSLAKTIKKLNPGTTYYYKACVVSGGVEYCGSVLSFTTTPCSNPTISNSSQPSTTAREYCKDEAFPDALTVEASGGVGEYTYQWKQCATSGGSYTNVSAGSGGTTDTYTPSTATAGGLYYKCVVTNKDICTSNSVTSNASGKYTINAPSATGNLKVGDVSPVSGTSDVCKGAANSTVTLSTTDNVGTTYKWEQYANSTWSQVGTDATYGAPISSVGSTQYRLSVKNGACDYSTPTTVTVRVNPVPSGTTITGSSPVCAGTTGLTYSASSTAVDGSTYSYAWEVTGTDWNITSAASSSTATMTAGTANGTVKVTPTLTTTASGKACAGSQVTKSVTVNTVPTISLTASPSSVYPWEYSTITATTTCTTLVWKLYQGGSLISTGAGSGANYSFARVSDTQYKLKGISSSGSGSSVTYTVKVDGSNANCDANQSTENITINPKATEPCGD